MERRGPGGQRGEVDRFASFFCCKPTIDQLPDTRLIYSIFRLFLCPGGELKQNTLVLPIKSL